eukprot:GFUD01003943.1.p1 GENE.GFUD01003943.1~~GFUD01003943.1.p1  ORF type:complete len:259 (+),score=62.33 GFUD01003943.1:29-805(+)
MSFSTRSILSALVFSSICLVMSSAEFCLVKSVETRPVRRSFLEPVKTPKNYTCCPNLSCNPPICTRYETVMEKKVKVEMVTAVVTRRKCCPGYNADGDSCLPLCPGGCVHGSCSAPHQCTCSPGYRGHACELYGCPPDTWGVGCQYQCQCRHFGTCHPATGECTCPPGYGGDSCQEVVANSTGTTTVDTSTTSSITTTVATTSTTHHYLHHNSNHHLHRNHFLHHNNYSDNHNYYSSYHHLTPHYSVDHHKTNHRYTD